MDAGAASATHRSAASDDPVGEDRGQHTVGDPQPVPLDQPLDGERHRHDQHRDAGGEPGEVDQQRGARPSRRCRCPAPGPGWCRGRRWRARGRARCPAMPSSSRSRSAGRCTRAGSSGSSPETRSTWNSPYSPGPGRNGASPCGACPGAAPDAGASPWSRAAGPSCACSGCLLSALLLVPLGWLGLLGLFRPLGRPGSFGLLDRARLFGSGSRIRPPLVLPLSRRLLTHRTLGRCGRFGRGAGGGDGQRLRGARLPWRRRTLLLGRLFLISYHQSPSGRWWHGRPVEGGIRVHSGGRGKWIILPAPGLSAPCRRPPGGAGPCVRSHCRCRAAGWTE